MIEGKLLIAFTVRITSVLPARQVIAREIMIAGRSLADSTAVLQLFSFGAGLKLRRSGRSGIPS